MTGPGLDQREIDDRNSEFWDELCGSGLAETLGITAITEESLARFDAAYMGYYPYLARDLERLPVETGDVLEIGLGFGTVGAILLGRARSYIGVDIAAGPVAMMSDRIRWAERSDRASAARASALELPYEPATFDVVVSIGCLHHTGDTRRAVSEVHRVLRPGGTAFVMLYNRHSFRQLTLVPRERLRSRGSIAATLRRRYDSNRAGEAAPHTDYFSKREVRSLFEQFSSVRIRAENFDAYTLRLPGRSIAIPRERLLGAAARLCGLDLYIHASK